VRYLCVPRLSTRPECNHQSHNESRDKDNGDYLAELDCLCSHRDPHVLSVNGGHGFHLCRVLSVDLRENEAAEAAFSRFGPDDLGTVWALFGRGNTDGFVGQRWVWVNPISESRNAILAAELRRFWREG
jgi:hypothetical protein